MLADKCLMMPSVYSFKDYDQAFADEAGPNSWSGLYTLGLVKYIGIF